MEGSSHQYDLVILGSIHDQIVLFERLQDLDKLLLRADQRLIRALPHTISFIETQVPLPKRICRSLLLSVLYRIDHLEDAFLLHSVKDERLGPE